MVLLREKIEKLRSLPVRKATAFNWVLHFLSVNGNMPEGWEMVWGKPQFTGRKRSKLRLLPTAVNWPTIKITEGATRSIDVNPEILDINPIPVPKTGGARKVFHRAFRANITSGDRTKTHHEVMEPHLNCGPEYSPECRDLEWELPIWIGGADWVQRPLYRHDPPNVRATFAQDPRGLIPKDTPLPHGPPGFIPPDVAVNEAPAHAATMDVAADAMSDVVYEAIGYKLSNPVGLVSKISSATKSSIGKLRKAWHTMSKSGSSAAEPKSQSSATTRSNIFKHMKAGPHVSARHQRKVEPPGIFSTRHKPGTPEHHAQTVVQAKELHRLIKKPMYVVDRNGKHHVTSNPSKHSKIVHTVESTTSASFPTQTTSGTTFFGRRGLATIEKERRSRMTRQSASKCRGYDPKCRDKDWEVPVPNGGAGLPLLKRSSIIS